jgi:glycine cleavage system H protein
MNNPDNLLYAETHEWVRVADEGGRKVATIGITAFAIEQLTDLVHMVLPKAGDTVKQGQEFGEVESVKAVSSLYSPVDGEIVAVNSDLPNKLETLGGDPYGAGWLIKVALSSEEGLSKLMDKAAYEKQCAAEG